MTPNQDYRLDTGEPLTLAPVLAKAGEGTVYGVEGRPEWAAKIFHPDLKGLAEKLDKVAAMVLSPPPGIVQPNGFVVLTWPARIIVRGDRPVGFVMARISTAAAVELHTMSNPADRADPARNAPQWTRQATWEHLVNTAANLSLAVQAAHRANAVIGDFQERNILVANTTEVTLVDCDSMQFADAAGRQFLCGVGRPEFTAPELAGVDLRVQPRARESDLFALAVHIHQLLMAGNHPFMRGDWIGPGEKPDAMTLARQGIWTGHPNSQLRTHRLAPPVSFLPYEMQGLFARAFTEGATNPNRRPTAAEWRAALLRITYATCSLGVHLLPSETLVCPWCVIDEERGRRGRTQPVTVVRRQPQPGMDEPALNPKLILGGLAIFVTVIVALTCFIVWGILSGSSTFGS